MTQHKHHMEHFREAKLYAGEELILEGVEGHLSCREKGHNRKEWHGYLEIPNERHIEAGGHFRLVLADGRTAEINAADIRGSEVPGRATHAVEFYVNGDIRGRAGHRYGLDRPTHHLS